MRDEFTQESVIDFVDSITREELYSEYNVLMSLADCYLKNALIQEQTDERYGFDGFDYVQEADTDKGGDEPKKKGLNTEQKAAADNYEAGGSQLKRAEGGPAVPAFVELKNMRTWYQKIWDWICKVCRAIRDAIKKGFRNCKKFFVRVKLKGDAEAEAYRKAGCKVIANTDGTYDIAFPTAVNLEQLNKAADDLVKIFEDMNTWYQKIADGDAVKGADNMTKRIKKVGDSINAATKDHNVLQKAEDFFKQQEDLAGRVNTIMQSANTIKGVFSRADANNKNSEAIDAAKKAAACVAGLQKAVDKSFDDMLQIISDVKGKAGAELRHKAVKKDAGVFGLKEKKEAKAVAKQQEHPDGFAGTVDDHTDL